MCDIERGHAQSAGTVGMAISITEGSVEVMHSSTISAFGESSLSFGKSGSQSSMNWHKCFIRNRDLCLGLLMMYNVQSNQ